MVCENQEKFMSDVLALKRDHNDAAITRILHLIEICALTPDDIKFTPLPFFVQEMNDFEKYSSFFSSLYGKRVLKNSQPAPEVFVGTCFYLIDTKTNKRKKNIFVTATYHHHGCMTPYLHPWTIKFVIHEYCDDLCICEKPKYTFGFWKRDEGWFSENDQLKFMKSQHQV
jgi:hypothetical protein